MAGMIPRSNSGTGTSVGGGIPDAPDNRLYLRTRGAWIEAMQAYYRGVFVDKQGLISAHPSDIYGAFAVVLDTGTFWIWSAAGWVDTEKNASGVGIEEAPADDFGYLRKNKNWVRASSGGTGVGKHAELPDLLPEGIAGDEANHITDAQLEFILDYVERRPIRPTNLSPVDLEMEVGERPRFESTPYLHPFNLVMYGYQMRVFDGGGVTVYDSGSLDVITVTHQIPAGILQEDTAYTWQVRYQSGNLQWSEWSEVTTFRTQVVFDSVFIMRPGILLPSQGDVKNSPFASVVTTPFEAIGGLIQADGNFEVATNPDFTTLVDSGAGKNTWIGSTELTHGEPYFVRAKHKATTGEVSPWSPTRTLIVRKFFREQRIGIVLVDQANWIWQRVDGDLNPVAIDDGYWLNNAIYAGWESSLNRDANKKPTWTIIDGQSMFSIPAFWIKSGIAEHGVYAGHRYWLIDPTTPSREEQEAGWHIHDAFMAPGGLYSDVLSVGAYLLKSNKTPAESTPTVPVSYDHARMTRVDWGSAINLRNSDAGNPLKRGWGSFCYRGFYALMLLGLIEKGDTQLLHYYVTSTSTTTAWGTSTNKFGNVFSRGIGLSNTAPLTLFGMYNDKLAIPGNQNAYITVPQIGTSVGAGGVAKADRFLSTADGVNAALRVDDLLIPTNNGVTPTDALSVMTTAPNSEIRMIAGAGPLHPQAELVLGDPNTSQRQLLGISGSSYSSANTNGCALMVHRNV